jgi:arylsulfatase A-like enzyme
VLGDIMDGFHPVGAFENRDAYFGWVASQGFKLPANRDDIWLPQGTSRGGATADPAVIPRELSDTAWFTERGLSYLQGIGARALSDGGYGRKPWFLHLGYYRPHPPFIAPAPYHAMYRPEDMPKVVRAASAADEAKQNALLAYYVNNLKQASFFQDGRKLGAEMSEAEVAQMRATYCGLLSEIDDQLGRVFAYLKATGQWDNTLIVFTCDHGEQLGDHHLLGKIGYFDESYRIPMIVRDPRAEASGTRGTVVEKFTETIDTMPTILEWLGLPVPRQCDGRSLLPFCAGAVPADWRTEAHYEYDFRDLYYSTPESAIGVPMDKCSLAVVQDERYKYVHFAALPPLFFDLEADPGQFVNRAGDPAYAARMAEYAAKMLDWRLGFAERSLTGYRATPKGLEVRAA